MKVAFWSPLHGQAKTTANMIGIALYSTLYYEQSNLIMQTHFHMNHLEHVFYPMEGGRTRDFVGTDIGLDALVRSIKSFQLDKEVIHNCAVSLIDKQLDLLTGTRKLNRIQYEAKIQPVLIRLIRAIEQHYDLVFIDTNSGLKDEVTNRILNDAEIIIINLCQNKQVIEMGMNLECFMEKKIMYLLGGYDKYSLYNVNNLIKMYPTFTEDNLAVIPYYTPYKDALLRGEVISFMKQCIKERKNKLNMHFIQGIQEATDKIRTMAGI